MIDTTGLDALLPCPHCGGKAELHTNQIAEDAVEAFVMCSKCFATTDQFEDAYAPTADAIAAWNSRTAHSSGVKADEAHCCPICAEPFKHGDTCATDIELGICHAECLEGSPTVNLRTGEPTDGPISTYPYEMDAPAEAGVEGDAKPVAWTWIENSGERKFTDGAHVMAEAEARGRNITPLYTHPSLLEECREVLESKARAFDACQWYWPEDDTSSEACADGPHEIVQNAYEWENADNGDVIAIARGGIVEVTYCASLPPADDADSDDDFWVEEATREDAQAKIDAEKARRATKEPTHGN